MELKGRALVREARFDSLGNLLRAYTKAAGLHGLRRAGWSHGPAALVFWLFLCGFAALFGFIILGQLISEYYAYPVKLSMHKTNHEQVSFPAITICNANPISGQNLSSEETDTLERLAESKQTEDDNSPTTEEQLKSKILALYAGRSQDLGMKLNDSILFCSYGGRLCDIRKLDFVVGSIDGAGVCFTFNAAGKKISTMTGASFGLNLILNVQPARYSIGTTRQSYRVIVTSRLWKSSSSSLDEIWRPIKPTVHGVSVPNGFDASVSLRLREYKRLDEPHGNCRINPVGGQTACREVDYHIDDVSLVPWPTENHKFTLHSALRSLYDKKDARRNVVPEADNLRMLASINVYFVDFSKEIIMERPAYSLLKFLSNVGGIMFLLTGASLLTLFEFVELFISLVFVHGGSSRSAQSELINREEERSEKKVAPNFEESS